MQEITIGLILKIMILMILLIISFVDYLTLEIPDFLSIAIGGLSLFRLTEGISVWKEIFQSAFFIDVPLILLVLLFERVLKKELLGGGDLKLIAAISLYFSPMKMLTVLMLSSFLGLLYVIVKRIKPGQRFAFGPMISISSVLCLILLI